MKVRTIGAVMIHIPDWKEGLDWYEKRFEAILADEKVGLYRDPRKLEYERRMCKLKEPSGNLVGLRRV